MEYIAKEQIRKEEWKYYLVLIAWPLYLFFLPQVFRFLGLYSILLIIYPGVYLFTWAGYLMPEFWHKYVPNIPNKFFYQLFSWMLLTDPQIYNMLHGGHHMNVNTWDDTEFHPLGKIKNIHLQRFYNWLQILLGVVFITLISLGTLPGNDHYKRKFEWNSFLTAVVAWIVLFGGLGWLAYLAFNLKVSQILHHSQLVEHGNLIVNGSYHERNIKTRNLRNQGEQVLHHTMVTVY